ncbi:response regulator, partial [Breznakiellaceae bacterium SP9]
KAVKKKAGIAVKSLRKRKRRAPFRMRSRNKIAKGMRRSACWKIGNIRISLLNHDTTAYDKDSILAADDDSTLLEMAPELLGEAYRIIPAKSGEQGFVPGSILPDIAMLRMDGYAGFIRSLP